MTSHVALWIGLALHLFAVNNYWSFFGALVSFIFFYGALYAMNDVADYKVDRRDPSTKTRVIASGLLSRRKVLQFIIPLWLSTMFFMYQYDPRLALVAVVLWSINIVYSWGMKAIPYADIIFISLTQPLKYFVALFLCGAIIPSFSSTIPFFLVVYFVAVLLHSEKQRGRLQAGSRRTFIVGEYSDKVLSLIGNVSLLLAIGAAMFLYGYQEFLWSVFVIIGGIVVRFVLSSRNAYTLISRYESTFQPK